MLWRELNYIGNFHNHTKTYFRENREKHPSKHAIYIMPDIFFLRVTGKYLLFSYSCILMNSHKPKLFFVLILFCKQATCIISKEHCMTHVVMYFVTTGVRFSGFLMASQQSSFSTKIT